ncbi:MAG: hypothetical protein AVDCRST_MAG49-1668 [uncultured Thermomicrobiales bacterium]|uniref:Uncharacterized protein n=1 Tax=uncultured Thermomicrobiales bacterium TaxID=1645740 RepID=A0A6J4UJI5_9BACT|nr:MAG: hypothetical protein AVDCRST_MAG49-1668 [uncultured Thermomicrobiales bacterium]
MAVGGPDWQGQGRRVGSAGPSTASTHGPTTLVRSWPAGWHLRVGTGE